MRYPGRQPRCGGRRGGRAVYRRLLSRAVLVALDIALLAAHGGAHSPPPPSGALPGSTAPRRWWTLPPRSKTTAVMPPACARSASSAPTCFALAVLSPSEPRIDASSVEAETRGPPTVSSTSCANRCRDERVTTSRGRTALPVMLFLTRR